MTAQPSARARLRLGARGADRQQALILNNQPRCRHGLLQAGSAVMMSGVVAKACVV
jgi:hypothetical protein